MGSLGIRLAQFDSDMADATRRGDIRAASLLEQDAVRLLSELAEYGFTRASDGRGGSAITIDVATFLSKIQTAYQALEQVRAAA